MSITSKTKIKNHFGGTAKISIFGTYKVKLKFKDTGYEKVVFKEQLYTKNIKDYNQKNALKQNGSPIACIGEGDYNLKKNYNLYLRWYRLLQRSLDGKIIVCDAWHNFQEFAKWYTYRASITPTKKNIIKRRLKSRTNLYNPVDCYIT